MTHLDPESDPESDPGSGPRRVPLPPDRYDERWEALAATGAEIHGEADLVAALVGAPATGAVLDAGCGTGRVAIELARRATPRSGSTSTPHSSTGPGPRPPDSTGVEGDLAVLPAEVAPGPFAAVVLAGNVMIFVARGTEAQVVANLASRLQPGGLLVAGFQLNGRLALADYDAATSAAGLEPVARWSTWDRAPFTESSDYVVAVDSKR